MIKLIPLILSLTLIGVGGAMVSDQKTSSNKAYTSSQNYMGADNSVDSCPQDSSELFLRANTNPSL